MTVFTNITQHTDNKLQNYSISLTEGSTVPLQPLTNYHSKEKKMMGVYDFLNHDIQNR